MSSPKNEAIEVVGHLIADWQGARADLAEIERSEHPDIADRFGRVWTWAGRNDTYRHCGNAAPAAMIDSFGLPTQAALDNPNYDLCETCLAGRERNVPDCKPEWNCTHTMHQSARRQVITTFPPGTRVILDDPTFGPYRGRVVVCLCKRHTWQPELQGRECGHAQCGFPPAADACPWPMHVVWDNGNESHQGIASMRSEA